MNVSEKADDLAHNLANAADLPTRLNILRSAMVGRLVFTTSFGLEDQVITHAIAQSGLDIELLTLDTGRLFPEVYTLWQATEKRYGLKIHPFYPDAAALESYVQQHGINGFYASQEARKTCCHIRKVVPLKRALSDAAGWITGLRADQSTNRGQGVFAEWNADYALIKASPLLDWSRERALAFAQEQNVPLNPLHDKGVVSIGCAPCTRAIGLGEPERAGRWWWEDEAKKECGLHVDGAGRIIPPPASFSPSDVKE